MEKGTLHVYWFGQEKSIPATSEMTAKEAQEIVNEHIEGMRKSPTIEVKQ